MLLGGDFPHPSPWEQSMTLLSLTFDNLSYVLVEAALTSTRTYGPKNGQQTTKVTYSPIVSV